MDQSNQNPPIQPPDNGLTEPVIPADLSTPLPTVESTPDESSQIPPKDPVVSGLTEPVIPVDLSTPLPAVARTPDGSDTPIIQANSDQQADPEQNISGQNPDMNSDEVVVDQGLPSTENIGGEYIDNVGVSLIDLLTDISLSEDLIQKVADTMRLPVDKARIILESLLDKIDKRELTEAEIAFIITAPVADENDSQEQAS